MFLEFRLLTLPRLEPEGEPTLTDCYVVLGYLNPDYLLGGDFKLSPEKAYFGERYGRLDTPTLEIEELGQAQEVVHYC